MVYLVIEGIDGSGKSEIAAALVERLREAGFLCACHRFTARGEGVVGRIIQRLYYPARPGWCFRAWDSVAAPKVLLFWFNARQTLLSLLHVKDPVIVVGDRSMLTLVAMYPSAFFGRALTRVVYRRLPFPLSPTALFLLDIQVETSLRRLRMRGFLEPNERPDRLARVARNYMRETCGSRRYLGHIPAVTIDAEQPLQTVIEEVTHRALELLQDRTMMDIES